MYDNSNLSGFLESLEPAVLEFVETKKEIDIFFNFTLGRKDIRFDV